jgi:hypothetical protein
MGGSLRDFLKRINASYFAGKLCSQTYKQDSKKTVQNIRRYIRRDMAYDLPWYKFMEEQKLLRSFLKNLEQYPVDMIIDRLCNIDLEFIGENEEFVEILKSHLSCEPWHFIGEVVTDEYKYFEQLHGKIKKRL